MRTQNLDALETPAHIINIVTILKNLEEKAVYN